MTILRERKMWRKQVEKPRRGFRLSAEERENIRRTLHVATRSYGAIVKLAKAMGVSYRFLSEAVGRRSRVSVAIALAYARATGTTVEDVLAGKALRNDRCPTCGKAR